MTDRTTIYYGGEEYVVAMRAQELKAAIDRILASTGTGWLRVNHGRGQLRTAEILIGPGVAVGLIDSSTASSAGNDLAD
jgi:hypothetical protein